MLDKYNSIYQRFEYFFDNWQSLYLDLGDDFKHLLYRIDDALFDFYQQNYSQGYSDPETIRAMETEFFMRVDDWFKKRVNQFNDILTQLLEHTE